jgi:hypothetical protein
VTNGTVLPVGAPDVVNDEDAAAGQQERLPLEPCFRI